VKGHADAHRKTSAPAGHFLRRSGSPAAAQDNSDRPTTARSTAGAKTSLLNAEPKPAGGALPGVVVTDTGLRGYVFSENVG
jgi:hypothetical protein